MSRDAGAAYSVGVSAESGSNSCGPLFQPFLQFSAHLLSSGGLGTHGLKRGQFPYLCLDSFRFFGGFTCTVATFPYHVSHILCVCTQAEMFRIETGWVVAGMHDAHILRNNSLVVLV